VSKLIKTFSLPDGGRIWLRESTLRRAFEHVKTCSPENSLIKFYTFKDYLVLECVEFYFYIAQSGSSLRAERAAEARGDLADGEGSGRLLRVDEHWLEAGGNDKDLRGSGALQRLVTLLGGGD